MSQRKPRGTPEPDPSAPATPSHPAVPTEAGEDLDTVEGCAAVIARLLREGLEGERPAAEAYTLVCAVRALQKARAEVDAHRLKLEATREDFAERHRAEGREAMWEELLRPRTAEEDDRAVERAMRRRKKGGAEG